MYEIFLRLCMERGVTPAEVSKATGIRESTLSNWKSRGTTISHKNAALIAEYFGVSPQYLITGVDAEKESVDGKKYYFSSETAEVAQELFETPGLRMLFDAARDSKPEDLQMAADLLKRLKGSNPNG